MELKNAPWGSAEVGLSTHAYVDANFSSKSGREKNEKIKHVIADVLVR